ncbi:MAG TPA: hypothetical protein VH209_07400, partial [Steroidobacteraceae bacterium]|nr:hypothetical protein [Steroidobacteraceae bacterium]
MENPIGRRRLLAGAGAALLVGALGGCSIDTLGTRRRIAPALELARLRASPDRITAITVCTRPFRAQGPRLDVERVGSKIIVHNYGHGGSGWSLSWGSSTLATRKALATDEREIGVIGCGALGLTSEFIDNYFVTDDPHAQRREPVSGDTRPKFAELQRELLGDLIPDTTDFG